MFVYLHNRIVKLLLSSHNFHRLAHYINGSEIPASQIARGYDKKFAAILRREKRAMFFTFFKQELKAEFFPWK